MPENNKCVLIVSAEKEINISVESALQRFSHDSIVACDFEDALNILNHGLKPHLILYDWDSKEVDGVTAIREFNSHLKDSTSPVIVMSASTSKETVINAVKAGAIDYIVKPFHLGRLILKVNSALSPSLEQESTASKNDLRLDAFAELQILDLSETGCAVQTTFPIKPGAMLMLESEEITSKLSIDAQECFPLKVANCTKQGRRYKVGGQFMGLSPTVRNCLKQACNQPKGLKGK